jgi:hypothetical protein
MTRGKAVLAHLLRCACAACFCCIIVFPAHAYDHLAFCITEGMASRKGTPSVNTVNNCSVENCANNAPCTSGFGGSSLMLGVSCVSRQCGV